MNIKINKSNIPCSQNLPSHPSAQTHVNVSMPSRQLPPFLHEMFSQLSISENSKKNYSEEIFISKPRNKPRCTTFYPQLNTTHTYFCDSGPLCNLCHICTDNFLQAAIHRYHVHHTLQNQPVLRIH